MDNRSLYDWWRVSYDLRNEFMAGVPANPAILEAWLRTRLKKALEDGRILESELIDLLRTTLVETKTVSDATYRAGKWYDNDGEPIEDEVIDAMIDEAIQRCERGMSVFKEDDVGIYIESRQVNSMLREGFSVDRLFVSKLGTKNAFQHRMFVEPLRIRFMRDGQPLQQADERRQEPMHSHQNTALKSTDLVKPPARLTFWIKLAKSVPDAKAKDDEDGKKKPGIRTSIIERLEDVLLLAQDSGLGACRSQEYGKLDLVEFELLTEPPELPA